MTRQLTVANQEKNDLPYRCAVSFKDLVFNKIMTGQLSHPDYSEKYSEFKAIHGGKGPWRLHDNIVESLTAFKSADGEGWCGGIPDGPPVNRVSYMGKKWDKMVPIAKYARYIEFGIGGNKKRPVFVPTTEEFRSNSFPEEVNKSAGMLKKAWR